MAKAFKLPHWRKRQIDSTLRRKELVAARAIAEVQIELKRATDFVVAHVLKTGAFAEPDLTSLQIIGGRFYRRVIQEGWNAAEQEAHQQRIQVTQPVSRGRLSGVPKGSLRPLKSLVELFGNSKPWQRVLSRKEKLMDRLKQSYLKKLKLRFDQILPRLLSGEATPGEVKKELSTAWEASQARVQTIFRTETTKYFTEAQITYFEQGDQIIGYLFDSLRDTTRSEWCKSRHGLIYRPGTELLRKNRPPCHWGCRSHLIALADTPANRKLLEDPERDPTQRKVMELPSGWSR
jgi:SPP1 gp7 family putative phage head morphogenesis protein